MGVSPKVRAEMFIRNSLGKLGLTKEAKQRILLDLTAEFAAVAVSKDRTWTSQLQAYGADPKLLDVGYGRD